MFFCGIGYIPLKVKFTGYLHLLIENLLNWASFVTQFCPYTFYTTSTFLSKYPSICMRFITFDLNN